MQLVSCIPCEQMVQVSQLNDRDRVQLSLQKFRELLNEHTKKRGSTTTSEVLKQMRGSYPSLCVNEKYAMLGEFGNVPGVEVGDCLNSRAELSLVGLHRPPQAGIDSKEVTFTRKDGNRELLALSLVVSGEYEDDSDQGDTIVYTGQGGKEKGAKQHSKDQKSEGGNEALRNSKIRQIPIRVIRGKRVPNRPSKMFCYDGLYKVASYVFEKGQSDFKVFKFTLVRDRDQAPLRPRGQLFLKGEPSGGRVQGDYAAVTVGERGEDMEVEKGDCAAAAVGELQEERGEDMEVEKGDCAAATVGELQGDCAAVTVGERGENMEVEKGDCAAATAGERTEDMEKEMHGESLVDATSSKQEDVDEDLKEDHFEVDYILDKKMMTPRRGGRKVMHYFIVWKDYPIEEGTWERKANLTNCKRATELFEEKLAAGRSTASRQVE